ncbi:unnamed protein product [Somion occarium]|uniref:Oxidized purine nucleoside triphosphate hydrolase n=1 Tax=Somion occarium TaxID=3059160 RepID=A0ABP1DP99_9APHY
MSISPPPGVTHEGNLIEVHNGGAEDWLQFSEVRPYTNAFIRQEGKILLGYKKRGFGKDLYNGFGGKLDPGETSLQAAERELQEEAGIQAKLRECGTLFFVDEKIAWAFHIHVFTAETFTGEVTETEEMRPQWFATQPAEETTDPEIAKLPQIPYSQMWADDVYWMPLLLSKTKFVARMDFASDGTLRKWWAAKEVQ